MESTESRGLQLIKVSWQGANLHYSVRLFERVFHCHYHYRDVCFDTLNARYGAARIEAICFHIVAFEMAKYCSLAPTTIDFGRLSHHCTAEFKALWSTVFKQVWGQWRYENNRPDYLGPGFVNATAQQTSDAIESRPLDCSYLLFSGGGKDSLVAMRTLDRHQISYGAFIYSHSSYGDHAHQQQLAKRQVSATDTRSAHQLQIDDDFLDGSALHTTDNCAGHCTVFDQEEITTILHAETPCSIFGALPLILMQGYGAAVLAHERSADMGNLYWSQTGEEINHQWGKSWQAETLLNQYIRQHLVRSFEYFSVLKPLTDVFIFNLLNQNLSAVASTHSCNIDKPWCKRCAKCAYVWLCMKAYLPNDLVDGIFAIDLFDVEANRLSFRQMLGLEAHTPFECIGQIKEARLALHFYRQTNHHPLAEALYEQCEEDWGALVDELAFPDFNHSYLPAGLEPLLTRYFEEQGQHIWAALYSRLSAIAKQPSAMQSLALQPLKSALGQQHA